MKKTNEIKRTKNTASEPKSLRIAIEEIVSGLVYISEIDSIVDVFEEEGLDEATFKKLHKMLKMKQGAEDLSGFRERLERNREWHRAPEKLRTEKYRALFSFLEEKLSPLGLLRVGAPYVDIYVAGKDVDGKLTGVRMKALET